MKLVYPEYGISMDFKEGVANVLTVEDAKVFTCMTRSLWEQSNGNLGEWILSDKDKVLSIAKATAVVFNPFSIDCNEKKIINKVYSELADEMSTLWEMETAELNGIIVDYLERVLQKIPYHLENRCDLDLIGLLKLFDVRICEDSVSVIERIIDYMKAVKQIMHIELLIFVNIKQYLTEEEVAQLYEVAIYEKISLFLVERYYQKDIALENNWILDRDLCIIQVDELTP